MNKYTGADDDEFDEDGRPKNKRLLAKCVAPPAARAMLSLVCCIVCCVLRGPKNKATHSRGAHPSTRRCSAPCL